MRRFLASAWFPFLICLILGGVTVAALVMLKPTGEGIDNGEIVSAFQIAGWVAGPAVALLSLIVIGILNLLRRLFRLRKVRLLHPVMILIAIVPWLVFSWMVMDEPRYTGFAIAAMEFVGRPLLWGTLVATVTTLLLSIPLLFPKKK